MLFNFNAKLYCGKTIVNETVPELEKLLDELWRN